jgi:amino acid transporter/mannitol/fructose-specific phosphotransferase system IIA component (Ntr-type)
MAILDRSKRLRKELSLLNVFAISLGATLSSGFFLLPGIAFAEAGPAVVLAYLIVILPLAPGILSKVELSTAMPRAGGVYFFLDRSIGPVCGTIGGIGTWFTLVLKVAFALVGMGAYLRIFWSDAPMQLIAVVLAVAFGALNCLGARRTGSIQVLLITGLLALLFWFIVSGLPRIEINHFDGFFDRGTGAIFSTAGIVCVSYIGLTKVASVSEEVQRPDQNLPRGMFLALITATVIYGLGTIVMVGVLPGTQLAGNLTPVSSVAERLLGHTGAVVMAIAALLAFFSVANAGILSASRYPLAMSRDQLMPKLFQRLGRFGTPTASVVLTVVLVIVVLLLLDPLRIAKVAGAFQLLLFAGNCLALVVMRESRIESYDPGYRAPFYPWLQIVGILAPLALITQMGGLAISLTFGLVGIGAAWYVIYGSSRVSRQGAILRVFSRLDEGAPDELERELRGILKEKGLREKDPFDEVVIRATVIEAKSRYDFEYIVELASRMLAKRLSCPKDTLVSGFLEGTRTGATPVTGGVALPHMRMADIEFPQMIIVRSRSGVQIAVGDLFGKTRTAPTTYALFFLVSPEADPGRHLRLLAELASRVDRPGFLDGWIQSGDPDTLKESLLRHDRFISIDLGPDDPAAQLIGSAIRDVQLPQGTLIAVVRRGRRTIVPRGDTVLEAGDRLTIIGDDKAMEHLRQRYQMVVEQEPPPI